jgi:hypothetical protein
MSAITDIPPVAMSRAPDSLDLVRKALDGLRYGEVTIAVHDGEIVQIARTEKLRPPRLPAKEEDRT